MAMSWRLTVGLLILWGLGVAALLWVNHHGKPPPPARAKLIPHELPQDIEWFEVRRPDGVSFRVRQVPFGEAGRFLVVAPLEEAARGDRISSLGFALKALESTDLSDRTPDAATLRGLDLAPPRIELELAIAGGRNYVIRVGRRNPVTGDAYVTVSTHPDRVFFLSGANADALNMTLDDPETGIVNRLLVPILDETSIQALEVGVRLQGAQGDPYNRLRARFLPQYGGWVVEAPEDMRGERLDEVKARQVIANVRQISAVELLRRPGGQDELLREFGLHEPALYLKIEFLGERPPLELRFRANEPKPREPGECYAWNAAYPGRVCRIERQAYYEQSVPRAWTELLPSNLFYFREGAVRRMRLVRTRGEDVSELEIVDTARPEEPARVWRVVRPEELAGTPSRDIQSYMSLILGSAQVAEVIRSAGSLEETLASMGLDRPEVRIEFTVANQDGTEEQHAYRVACEGTSVRAYREGAGYWVLLRRGDPDWYSSVRMGHLPLRGVTYIDLDPASLRLFEVNGERRIPNSNSIVSIRWGVQYDTAQRTWTLAEGYEYPEQVDLNRTAELENLLQAFRALSLETDDPAEYARYGLGPDDRPLSVRLVHENRAGARIAVAFRAASLTPERCYAEFDGAVIGFPPELYRLLVDGVGR